MTLEFLELQEWQELKALKEEEDLKALKVHKELKDHSDLQTLGSKKMWKK